jgi:hypothetical protein
MSFDDGMADALAVMDDLTAVLADETAAVSRHDVAEAARLHKRKAALGEAYAAQMRRLQTAGGGGADPDALAALAAAGERLEAAVEDNLRTLDVARAAAQTVFNVIAESARSSVGAVDGYTQGGANLRGAANRCVSVALDGRF